MLRAFLFTTVSLLLVSRTFCSSVLVADFRMTRMVELSSRPPYCKVHSDRGDIQRMLLAFDAKKVRQVPRESVISLEEVCNEASGISGELQGGLGFIYPGTKWCGPGSIAANYSDVGRYSDEDRCCREHDMCPNILLPGECRRGLCNRGTFTRSHCDCDARFRRCLQNLNTELVSTSPRRMSCARAGSIGPVRSTFPSCSRSKTTVRCTVCVAPRIIVNTE